MVAIGDDQFLVGHGRGQQADGRGVIHAPQPVRHAVLVGHFGVGRAVAVVENLLRASQRVGVEHENLPEVRPRGLEQVEPVALGLGKRLLVPEDHIFRIIVQLAQRDKAAPLLHNVGSGNPEALRISKDARVVLLGQDAMLAPGAKISCRARIDVFVPLGVK